MRIHLVNMVPRSLSSETNDDSETNLSLNPARARQIVGTAFTPYGAPNTPIYLSKNGGDTWTLNAIVPGPTGDYNVKFSSRALYGGNLRPVGAPRVLDMDALRTPNPFVPSAMSVVEVVPGAGWPRFYDQPWVQVHTERRGRRGGRDRLYVGGNDLTISGDTATIDISLNAAVPAPVFKRIRLDTRPTTGQDGPSIRIAIHRRGIVYAAYFGYRPPGGSTNSDVVVARDDRWGGGTKPFRALVDPADAKPGVRVTTGINTGWFVGLGPDRTGSDLALAVDPARPAHVWVAWCDLTASSITLHVRRSTNYGRTWSPDLLTVPKSKNPGLAVNADHQVGVLYQQLTGPAASSRWEEHLQVSRNGQTWHDHLLAKTAATNWTGDYSYLTARGDTFYGIFAADNTPDHANFPHGVRYQRNADFATKRLLDVAGTTAVSPSIDPFFFRAD